MYKMMWAALALSACAAPSIDGRGASLEKAPFVGLRISQVAYDTPGEEAFEEFIDIFNKTAAPMALAGWSLADGDGVWSFPETASVDAGKFFTVARDRDGFFELHGRSPNADGFSLFLDNGGDALFLVDPSGDTADAVAWQWFEPGWLLYTPEGDSLVRLHPDGLPGLAGDWVVRSPAHPDGGE